MDPLIRDGPLAKVTMTVYSCNLGLINYIVHFTALNGQLSKEHVTALHTIYEQFHSKLLTPLPPSPVSYDITNGSQDCVTNSSVHVSFNLDSTCVTSDVANENEDDDGVQQFSSEKQQDHKPTTTNPKAPPKLNRRQQQARSDAENIILLSVREDLKYFKESMSMSIPSKNKPRKSLLPPLKSNTIAKGKKRRSDVSTKRSKKKVVHSVDESSVVSANPTFGCSNTNLDVPNSMDSESVTSSNDADKSTDNTQITLQTTSPQHLSTSTAAPAKTNFNTKAVFDSKRRHSFLSPRPNQEPDHKQSAAFSTRRSSVPAGQLSRRSSLFRSGLKSKMLSNGRLPTPDRPQFAVSLMNEIGDIKSLVQTIIVCICNYVCIHVHVIGYEKRTHVTLWSSNYLKFKGALPSTSGSMELPFFEACTEKILTTAISEQLNLSHILYIGITACSMYLVHIC